jgi:hypothetical protein
MLRFNPQEITFRAPRSTLSFYYDRSALPLATSGTQELQAKPSEPKPRKPIGFIQTKDDDDKK